jgi:alkaline phosphatase D
VARVHENPYEVKSPVIASEFVGTSITSTHNGTQADAERQASKNPHCLLSNYEKRGYGVVELTSDYARVDLRVLDDVRNEKSGITTLASFVVDNGKAVRFSGIER